MICVNLSTNGSPSFWKNRSEKSKIAVGLAWGGLWTLGKGIKEGDLLLCPNGEGAFWVAEVISPYNYHPGQILPHRRQVRWFSQAIDKTEMSLSLDFLIKNWRQTELGQLYDIFEEEGELVGQQYPSDTGPIDILAISKDKKKLLVVELKRGRASDAVVGQIQRYMGFVKAELCEANQDVKGVIIALDDDLRLQRTLSVAPNISFYRYQISFKLLPSGH